MLRLLAGAVFLFFAIAWILWESAPSVISDFRASVDQILLRLRAQVAFKDAILKHPWISAPDQHTEEILEDPEYLSSMVIFLNAVEQEIPASVLSTIGIFHKRLPALELQWLEVLLSHAL